MFSLFIIFLFFFFKQKTEYEFRIRDWSSDVCSSDLQGEGRSAGPVAGRKALHLPAIEHRRLEIDQMCRLEGSNDNFGHHSSSFVFSSGAAASSVNGSGAVPLITMRASRTKSPPKLTKRSPVNSGTAVSIASPPSRRGT